MAKTTKTKVQEKPAKEARAIVTEIPSEDSKLKQVFKVIELTSEEEILKYDTTPGVELEFDPVQFKKLDDSFVAILRPSAQKAYWLAKAEFESRVKLANRALFETPTAVDPMTKLLDGPHGRSNPLVRDQEEVTKLLPGYYVTWRVEGGQGDLEQALASGFRVIRRPKDASEKKLSPLEWSGDRWTIRDGTVDPISRDEIYNVLVVIREGAWKDNLTAMSMVSHNAYAANKQQFVEGIDNISRDASSAKERIQISDLDEMHVEEHTIVQDGKRIHVNP